VIANFDVRLLPRGCDGDPPTDSNLCGTDRACAIETARRSFDQRFRPTAIVADDARRQAAWVDVCLDFNGHFMVRQQ
jgi:hypothetical protein